jgi:hypothetical protein
VILHAGEFGSSQSKRNVLAQASMAVADLKLASLYTPLFPGGIQSGELGECGFL